MLSNIIFSLVSSKLVIADFSIASSTDFALLDIMDSKIISIDSFAILLFANNSKDFKTSSVFSNDMFKPCL